MFPLGHAVRPCHTECRIAANFCLISGEIGLDDPTLSAEEPLLGGCALGNSPKMRHSNSFLFRKKIVTAATSPLLSTTVTQVACLQTPPPLKIFLGEGVSVDRLSSSYSLVFESTDYHPKLVWSACVCRATRY